MPSLFIDLEKADRKPRLKPPMTAKEYWSRLSVVAKRAGLLVDEIGSIYHGKSYPFSRVVSPVIGPTDKVVLIRAGTHGEEISGPLTILQELPQMAKVATRRGLKLIIYPLVNPDGFENSTRYSKSQKTGDDFVRYANDGYKGKEQSLPVDTRIAWKLTSKCNAEVSQETEAMQLEMLKIPWRRVVAFIDFHQDYWLPKGKNGPAAYFYIFGDRKMYLPLSRAVRKFLPIYSDRVSMKEESADKDGFVSCNDGSFADAVHKMGVRHSVVVETTGSTPLDLAVAVNMVWFNGITSLVRSLG